MSSYAIGLDIGITSVGWAVLALDSSEKPYGIISLGSRIFDAAEQPKTGASLAAPRREARSMRRRIRRKRHRSERIKALFVSSGLLSKSELENLFVGQLEDIYALRVKALDELVAPTELARILLHISQRRGFKSNRKNPSTKEDGALLNAVNENKNRMVEHSYRTVGEMLLLDSDYSDSKRNKGGTYKATVSRDMVEDEVNAIFAAQRKLGSSVASEGFEEKYLSILLSQRSFDEGPGTGSPYGGNQIEKMIGHCTFFPNELRAAKASYSFEYFTLLQKVNHMRIVTNKESVKLTDAQRKTVIDLALSSKGITYARLRKALGLSADQTFNISYSRRITIEEFEKKEKFKVMSAYHEMRTAVDRVSKGRFAFITKEQRNAIGTTLTMYKTSDKIRNHLEEAGLESFDIDAVETIGSFSKFGNISIKACDKLIPYLEEGMDYDKACAAAEIDFKAHGKTEKSHLLHPTEDDYADLTSPVVRRAVSQTVKVLNAIIRKQGCSPTFINIELAREMSKDFSERNKIKKEQEENKAVNERLKDEIKEIFKISHPSGQDIVKYRLYKEQAGTCLYSLKQFSPEKLFSPGYAEVDHIIPYSISFDDSRKNKVLVFAEENRNKSNRLPLQYLTGQRRDDFIVYVKSNVRDSRKLKNLLKESISAEDREGFRERNLQDTKTISRFLLNYINDNLEFARSSRGRKKKVMALNGSITSYLRKRWGITKIRENGDLHHAVDAVVIGCATDGMIQEVSRFAALRECEYTQTEEGSMAVDPSTGDVLKVFPSPWPDFRKELDARLGNDPTKIINELRLPFYMDSGLPLPEPVFVSRMPRRKVTGAAHEATVRGLKSTAEKDYTISKTALTNLTLKDGEIKNYYNKESDTLLYEALKARLIQFNGDAKKAFAEEFRKPKRDGTLGPVVKSVKLCEPTTLYVPVHGESGVANNDSMVRVDVFCVGGKYLLVPIYVADTKKATLPSKAIVQRKAYSEWPEVSDDDFIFSLYPNDLIRVSSRNKIKLTNANKDSTLQKSIEAESFLLYYKSASISTGSVCCVSHDGAYKIDSLGVKTLEKLEKFTVDVLGEYHQVEKEPRLPFNMKRR